MRTIESRRFVSGAAELRLFLVEESEREGPLPFRVRLKLGSKGGVMAGYATEDEAAAALEVQAQKAVLAGWTQVPAQVRLALDIPAAPGSVVAAMIAAPAPACVHGSIQAWLPRLAPGKSAVCPDCGAEVGP